MDIKRALLAVISICTLLVASSRSEALDKPIESVEHVIVISVDGLRPDMALRANMPNLRSLLARGSYSFWARTTEVSITLPSHTSMLTGVTPATHKVDWNDDRAEWDELHQPTLFERGKAAGYTTALAASKTKFKIFNKPGVVDQAYVAEGDLQNVDELTTAKAIEMLTTLKPGVMLLHVGSVDGTGHAEGWGTPAQVAAIENVDRLLGQFFAAIDSAGMRENTVIILSADHGGSGLTHGADDPRSRHIPWICAGPGIAPNVDLTKYRDLIINTEDTYATACWLLGLTPGDDIDGKPIRQVQAERGELLEDVAAQK